MGKSVRPHPPDSTLPPQPPPTRSTIQQLHPDRTPESPADNKLDIPKGTKIGFFEIRERIAPESGQNNIFVVRDSSTNKDLAMKVEHKGLKPSAIQLELWVLLTMRKKTDNSNFCKVLARGSWQQYEFMILTLCGKSIRNLLKNAPGHKFSLGCALSVAAQCLRALMHLHKVGFIHRDVQPANFAIGKGDSKQLRTVYVLDFYYIHQFRHQDGRLKTERPKPTPLAGAPRYAPRAAHEGRELSRADDIEAWMYVTMEMCMGTLPWDGMKSGEAIAEEQNKLRSDDDFQAKIFKGFPKELRDLYRKANDIKYEGEPEYGEMLDLLDETRKRAKEHEFPYDWESAEWAKKL